MFESRILFFISFCAGDIVQVQFPFYIIQKVYLKNDEISHYRYVFGLRYCVLMNDIRVIPEAENERNKECINSQKP